MYSDDLIPEVLAAEREWTQAHLHGDAETIERLMADDYIRVQPNGSLANKTEVLAAYQFDLRRWESAQGDEYEVRIYGNTAVVIGRWKASGYNHDERFDYSARFVAVYVKHNDLWQMVVEQSTEITG